MSFIQHLPDLTEHSQTFRQRRITLLTLIQLVLKDPEQNLVIFLRLHRYKTLHHQLVLVQFLKVLSSSLLRVTLPPL